MPNKANCCCSDPDPPRVNCPRCKDGALQEYALTASGFTGGGSIFNGTIIVPPMGGANVCNWRLVLPDPGVPIVSFNLTFFSSPVPGVNVNASYARNDVGSGIVSASYRLQIFEHPIDCVDGPPWTLSLLLGSGPATIEVSVP